MPEPQSPLALANFIIDQTVKDHQPVTNRKLNKLMFLLQGYWLTHHQKPLTTIAFKYNLAGPLETTVYPHFKFHGSSPITFLATQVNNTPTGLCLVHPKLVLSNNQQAILTNLIHTLNQLPSHRLTSLINHHAPLTDQVYTDDDLIAPLTDRVYTDEELIACYEGVTAVCQQ